MSLQYSSFTNLAKPNFNTISICCYQRPICSIKNFPLKFSGTAAMEYELNTNLRNSHKAISKWKHIHIREVDDPLKAVAYVNKETKKNHYSLDYQNSILIQQ